MMKTNYHTHSLWCDGKATIEQMIQSAIEKKFDALGFSGHAMYPFGSDWHMAPRSIKDYIDELDSLKEKYSDKINILKGFEADYISGVCTPDFSSYSQFNPDFIIGSVHYVTNGKGYFEADGSFNEVHEKINKLYNGNSKKAVQTYFSCQREMLKNASFTFLGHCDLIRKQNSKKNPAGPLFNENDSWYKKELKETADAIKKSGICIEVNTGGIARGYLDIPYPSPYFLELLHDRNIPVTINSDSHSPDTLDCWFQEALKYIKKAGYKEIAFLDSGSIKFQKIQND